MVQSQLDTLEHLRISGYGCPFARHGLHLLFWFANDCVNFELTDSETIMKLMSDCQPEKGFYGFHVFSNNEEILPVLGKTKGRKKKRKFVYYEVGNLNTETFSAAANLPSYVRENYELDQDRSNHNIDRIIISYQVQTRVVDSVYITEHDRDVYGSFNPYSTFKVSLELIHALQQPELDISTFLIQMGYYANIQMSSVGQIYHLDPSAQQMFNSVQTYGGSRRRENSEAFYNWLGASIEPHYFEQQDLYTINVTSNDSRLVANYSGAQHKRRKPKATRTPRALRQSYWPSEWEPLYEGFDGGAKKSGGGDGISFMKLLLGAGLIYLAVKGFSWLRSSWKADIQDNILKGAPWRPPSSQHPHIMLDYVF
ncbi:uncharacterized protein V6R79_003547 [Siganus canaliculatus]